VSVDVLDLSIICRDARQKLAELLLDVRIDVRQLSCQLVALGLDNSS
jgi:hypothetical protein